MTKLQHATNIQFTHRFNCYYSWDHYYSFKKLTRLASQANLTGTNLTNEFTQPKKKSPNWQTLSLVMVLDN